jgi:hypothetical protein
MATDLKDTIASNATSPAEARGDTVSIRRHSLTDLIAADKHLASKDALSDPRRKTLGVRMVKLVAPGGVL